ncbi:hypothetical protein WN944_009024 [Citrus x changshan-huyou]|uniref:Uncharacterized protein n=1 Tax=Citrus x changshan-huyou TaxID=2935761 RepID=A0AAP0MS76_9ROSI
MQPAVTGTRNVLNACIKAKVEKVVAVSSIGQKVRLRMRNAGLTWNFARQLSFGDVETLVKLSSEKSKNLGWKYRPFERTLVDAVKDL